MPLVDDRGRLFGRINLIDLAVLVFVAALLPLGYGAYALFRQPVPRIVSVSPKTVTYNKGEQAVIVTGENLRPFLKAMLGKADARAFIVERPGSGELRFVDLPPGTYDLTLFDEATMVTRMTNALTVTPVPPPPVQLVGRFVGAHAAPGTLAPGTKLAAADIVDVGPALAGSQAATLRIPCDGTKPCAVGGTVVEIGKPITLRSADGDLSFVPDELRADAAWADLQVQLFGIEEVLEIVKAGDVDRHGEPDAPNASGVRRGAVVVSADRSLSAGGQLTLNLSVPVPDASLNGSGQVPMRSRLAVLRVPLERRANGWFYRESWIRVGSAMRFETEQYVVSALVLRMPVVPTRDKS